MATKQGKVVSNRLFQAIGKIGYSPESAILDICDNAISWGALNINVILNRVQSNDINSRRQKAVIESILICDDGIGMDVNGIDNAFAIGSTEEIYTPDTLSKFGLGLKSAASSLGGKLEIISRKSTDCYTGTLDITLLKDNYEYELDKSSESDIELLNNHTKDPNKSGTIIRISKINTESLKSSSEIEATLKEKVGVIYQKYISRGENKLNFFLDSVVIQGIDPQFKIMLSDADILDDNWDGISPKWILKPQTIQLDLENKCTAKVSVVQLPHPPSWVINKKGTASDCRNQFHISAQNYGFYIYRNDRLIGWADSLDGMIGQDQDLYSFRGSIEIDSAADQLLNLDVTKSRIILSEIAKGQLSSKVQESKKRSIEAWRWRSSEVDRITKEQPHEVLNEAIDKAAKLIENEEKEDIKVSPPDEKKLKNTRIINQIQNNPASLEESRKLREKNERVQYHTSLPNNQLWQRVMTPEGSIIVRVNQGHRFYVDLLNEISNNEISEMLIETFLYILATSEYKAIYSGKYEEKVYENIMTDFREIVGSNLSDYVKRLDKSIFKS